MRHSPPVALLRQKLNGEKFLNITSWYVYLNMYIFFPSHVRCCAFSVENKYSNFDILSRFTKGLLSAVVLLKSVLLSDRFTVQSMTKCISYSTTLQFWHSRWHAVILPPFLRCLPFSICKEWELVRILVIAFIYLKFLTESICFSMPKVVLIFA